MCGDRKTAQGVTGHDTVVLGTAHLLYGLDALAEASNRLAQGGAGRLRGIAKPLGGLAGVVDPGITFRSGRRVERTVHSLTKSPVLLPKRLDQDLLRFSSRLRAQRRRLGQPVQLLKQVQVAGRGERVQGASTALGLPRRVPGLQPCVNRAQDQFTGKFPHAGGQPLPEHLMVALHTELGAEPPQIPPNGVGDLTVEDGSVRAQATAQTAGRGAHPVHGGGQVATHSGVEVRKGVDQPANVREHVSAGRSRGGPGARILRAFEVGRRLGQGTDDFRGPCARSTPFFRSTFSMASRSAGSPSSASSTSISVHFVCASSSSSESARTASVLSSARASPPASRSRRRDRVERIRMTGRSSAPRVRERARSRRSCGTSSDDRGAGSPPGCLLQGQLQVPAGVGAARPAPQGRPGACQSQVLGVVVDGIQLLRRMFCERGDPVHFRQLGQP